MVAYYLKLQMYNSNEIGLTFRLKRRNDEDSFLKAMFFSWFFNVDWQNCRKEGEKRSYKDLEIKKVFNQQFIKMKKRKFANVVKLVLINSSHGRTFDGIAFDR